MTRKLLASLAIFILILAVAGVALAAKTYRAERFDADWQINPDGSLSVTESVVFNFTGGPFTFVFRELPNDYSDGVEVLGASLDGQPLGNGTGAGQYEVEGRGDQRVTWHFAPVSGATRAYELSYRVLGAVRREGGEDVLVWNFLPTDYEYSIDSATLRVTYPASAELLAPPEVRRGRATVEVVDSQVVFQASNIRKDSALTVALRFPGGSLISQPPAWQQRAARYAQRAPAMWLLAAVLLSLGTVALAWVWRAGTRDGARSEPRAFTRSTPPSNLPPALAGALVNHGARAGLVQAMATLFVLAQRGVLAFEESGKKKWYRSPQFVVRFQPRALDAVTRDAGTRDGGALEPHEEALVDALFTEKGGYEISFAQLGRRLSSRTRPFARAVEAELIERGLLDPARAAHASRFMWIGVALLALLIPAGVAAAFLARDFGGWVLLIPLAIFLLSMAAFVLGASYSRRSAQGEEQGEAWRGFREYMVSVTKGREPNWDLQLFDRYFPYAATFDLAQGWAKAFRDRGGGEVPAWFRSLATTSGDQMGAFIVMTSAAHSSASPGGAGAGGAGGGGASGAG